MSTTPSPSSLPRSGLPSVPSVSLPCVHSQGPSVPRSRVSLPGAGRRSCDVGTPAAVGGSERFDRGPSPGRTAAAEDGRSRGRPPVSCRRAEVETGRGPRRPGGSGWPVSCPRPSSSPSRTSVRPEIGVRDIRYHAPGSVRPHPVRSRRGGEEPETDRAPGNGPNDRPKWRRPRDVGSGGGLGGYTDGPDSVLSHRPRPSTPLPTSPTYGQKKRLNPYPESL